jgi:hypothetical protein
MLTLHRTFLCWLEGRASLFQVPGFIGGLKLKIFVAGYSNTV